MVCLYICYAVSQHFFCQTLANFCSFSSSCLEPQLVNSLAKVLANRLGKVLAITITSHQSAFVKGCQILDVAFVANEVVDDVRSRKRDGVIFKLDFEKAYDRVN